MQQSKVTQCSNGCYCISASYSTFLICLAWMECHCTDDLVWACFLWACCHMKGDSAWQKAMVPNLIKPSATCTVIAIENSPDLLVVVAVINREWLVCFSWRPGKHISKDRATVSSCLVLLRFGLSQMLFWQCSTLFIFILLEHDSCVVFWLLYRVVELESDV